VGIHRLLHSSCCFLNTNTAITRQNNSNSENARSRIVASLRGSVCTGTKVDESSTGRVWAAGFHHVTARSRLARVLKMMTRLFHNFPNFFRAAANRGYGGPPVFCIKERDMVGTVN